MVGIMAEGRINAEVEWMEWRKADAVTGGQPAGGAVI